MLSRSRRLLAGALALPSLFPGVAAGVEPRRITLVACAPGYPGSSAEAQGAMDAFAAALSARSGIPAAALGAVYEESEPEGVRRLGAGDAAAALVTLPFYLKYEKELGLRARLQAAPKGRGAMERWSLVAKKGRVASAAALEDFSVVSLAGLAPAFVRGPALGAWGRVPQSAHIVHSGAVLSALRRAAAGEPVAVLLDGAQEAALGSLPSAPELEVVARSPPLPAGIVAAVGRRLSAAEWTRLEGALEDLGARPDGAAALEGIRMSGFVPLDGEALAAARRAYAEASQ